MSDFNKYLDEVGEIGTVEEVLHSIVYATGLPGLQPGEIVFFEKGQMGQTFSISKEKVEILALTHDGVKVGDKIARTGKFMSVKVSDAILGHVLDALGRPDEGEVSNGVEKEVDVALPTLRQRRITVDPIETGVSIVDVIIPIGRGQRELVIGDRKTGKTQFFVRTIKNQARKGNVCIYASIGKKTSEIKEVVTALREEDVWKNTVVVASQAADSPCLVYLTPYVAMAIAEYFRDQGKHVILILDDLTNHAKYFREISLLAGYFPGRSSYPGNIFYLHSKLLERAGNFEKGSITCFPVAESIMGDLSGYIQTNLMSITDGHIFFDLDLANLGRRPAINPFLSVTRIGEQPQTPLVRDLSREVGAFLVTIEQLKDLLHFGAELSEEVRQKLELGDRIIMFFDQPVDNVPMNITVLGLSMLWIGAWRNQGALAMKDKVKKMCLDYEANAVFRKNIDNVIARTSSFKDFLNHLREQNYGQENYY